jgi:hypothetical protein
MAFGQIVAGDEFDDFLQSHGQDISLGNRRFVARNFLLDENVAPERQSSYHAAGAMKHHAAFKDWQEIHNEDYLHSQVFLRKLRPQIPTLIDPADLENCPETFRQRSSFRTFGASDAGLELIRVERVERMAHHPISMTADKLLQAAHDFLTNRSSVSHKQDLDAALEEWQSFRDLRPVWSGYWIDVKEIFEPNLGYDPEDWPNELRDCLGLCHLDPFARPGVEINIEVFRYRVGELPGLQGERTLRPLAVPTVLDGQFGEAFCPAPNGQACGYVVYLGSAPYRPRREILHPAIQFGAEHLYKVGKITRPVPADLSAARREHLSWVRGETGRSDYSVNMDGDL